MAAIVVVDSDSVLASGELARLGVVSVGGQGVVADLF
jgi:hypothetical protein